MELTRTAVTSPVGRFVVEGDATGVTRIYLPSEAPRVNGATPAPAVAQAATQLAEYLAGTRRRFSVRLAPAEASDFRHAVWSALEAIPYGEVRTYAEVAGAIGRPGAQRAVGQANAANPWPVVVPCHRVVASDGIGGYAGGDRVKRFLLGHEGLAY
jgi:methylated-DNA-[protein]-cysteine S-methyltransferase